MSSISSLDTQWSSCAVWNHSTARAAAVGEVSADAIGSQAPRAAIVRKVPDTFASALAMEKPLAPIDLELAKQQHAAYVKVLNGTLRSDERKVS